MRTTVRRPNVIQNLQKPFLDQSLPMTTVFSDLTANEGKTLEQFLSNFPEACMLLNVRGQIQYANQQAYYLFSKKKGMLIGLSVAALFKPVSGNRISAFKEFRLGQQGEVYLSHLNKWVSYSWYSFGKGIVFYCRDVSAQKRSELQLRESEDRFWTLANTAPVIIWMSEPDKLRTYFNKGWLDFTGRTIDQEFGEGWVTSIHPEDKPEVVMTYRQMFDKRLPLKLEYRLRRYDGQYRWILDSGSPRYSSEGKFLGYIGSCIDITDRKETESALLLSEQRFRTLVEQSPVSMQIFSPDGKTIKVNRAWEKLWGVKLEQLRNYNIWETILALSLDQYFVRVR